MAWTIDQTGDTYTATHAQTGATFKATKSGWIGCIEAGTATEAELRGLMSEVVVMLRLHEDEPADQRVLH